MIEKNEVTDSGDPLSTKARSLAPQNPTDEKMREAVAALFEENELNNDCDVDVSVDGQWCTFEGQVDSQEVRTALFDLVPARSGKRYIVDRLQVTYGYDDGEVC